jgi:hypothetical protein
LDSSARAPSAVWASAARSGLDDAVLHHVGVQLLRSQNEAEVTSEGRIESVWGHNPNGKALQRAAVAGGASRAGGPARHGRAGVCYAAASAREAQRGVWAWWVRGVGRGAALQGRTPRLLLFQAESKAPDTSCGRRTPREQAGAARCAARRPGARPVHTGSGRSNGRCGGGTHPLAEQRAGDDERHVRHVALRSRGARQRRNATARARFQSRFQA